MEFGLRPKMVEFDFDSQQQTQIVNASKESRTVQEHPSLVEVIKREQKEAIDDTKDVSKNSSRFANFNEFALTNFNFGFNNDSHDFFVKAIRGEAENQYPTDDMMRLKAYLQENNEAS